ncbi:MAG TPA: putative glycoside hydrolase [bacterium]|nr:putative glycoside hydrolase [bacterium]HPN81082.1 putative glycoside hydrolase [bacterium]HPW39174.1 putative glycoside hydrolase [bacterium]
MSANKKNAFNQLLIAAGLAVIIILLSPLNWLDFKRGISRDQSLRLEPVIPAPTPWPEPLATPEKVKGIYLTGNTFASASRRDYLIKLVERTELNAVVIDVKDHRGRLAYDPNSPFLATIPTSSIAMANNDYKEILETLQAKNIYTIARITNFQDPAAVASFPELALKNQTGSVWQDFKGMVWLDMTNPASWQIPIEQAKDAALIGFDEVQFDYIRFPTDGNIKQIAYANPPVGKKYHTLAEFYRYLDEQLADLPIPLSVDLFGLTYHHRADSEYDLNIGQRLIDAALYFDYISPMVYPSHYPTGYLGFANPAAHPYEIVNKAMGDGNLIMAQATSSQALSRPWLQDFDLGANYDTNMVRAQIKAADANNTAGWLIWNASNRYTEDAFLTETKQ